MADSKSKSDSRKVVQVPVRAETPKPLLSIDIIEGCGFGYLLGRVCDCLICADSHADEDRRLFFLSQACTYAVMALERSPEVLFARIDYYDKALDSLSSEAVGCCDEYIASALDLLMLIRPWTDPQTLSKILRALVALLESETSSLTVIDVAVVGGLDAAG